MKPVLPSRPWRQRVIVLSATWFGVGYLPIMPGTWGSLAALPLWWLLRSLEPLTYALAMLGLGLAALYLCGRAEKLLGKADPPCIVLDEVLGQLLALAACSPQWQYIALGVILFRFFDILKPFPIGLINARLQGGLGIVLDDVVAGLFAGILLVMLVKWISL